MGLTILNPIIELENCKIIAKLCMHTQIFLIGPPKTIDNKSLYVGITWACAQNINWYLTLWYYIFVFLIFFVALYTHTHTHTHTHTLFASIYLKHTIIWALYSRCCHTHTYPRTHTLTHMLHVHILSLSQICSILLFSWACLNLYI